MSMLAALGRACSRSQGPVLGSRCLSCCMLQGQQYAAGVGGGGAPHAPEQQQQHRCVSCKHAHICAHAPACALSQRAIDACAPNTHLARCSFSAWPAPISKVPASLTTSFNSMSLYLQALSSQGEGFGMVGAHACMQVPSLACACACVCVHHTQHQAPGEGACV